MRAKRTSVAGWKGCIAVLLPVALMLAAGCFGLDNGTPETSGDDADGAQTAVPPAPLTSPLPAAPVPRAAEPAGDVPEGPAQAVGGGISFQLTKVSPEWEPMGGYDARNGQDFTFVEDGLGVLHLIYNDYHMQTFHCYKEGDGNWTEPRFIVVASTNRQGYWVGTAPDGSLCFAWKEGVFSAERSHYCVLHMMYFRDGEWAEDSRTYDYADEHGEYQLTVQWFNIVFDAQGSPHFFYYADEFAFFSDDYFADSRCGLYLDSRYLAQYDITGQTTTQLAPGVGDLANDPQRDLAQQNVYFYIDSGNVFHLIGYDRNAPCPGLYSPSYTRCLHSISRDGGMTWEGPFVLFDGADPISRISFAEDSKGNLRLMAYRPGSDDASLLTATLEPDSYAAGAAEGHFGGARMEEYLRDLPYEERMGYENLSFWGVLPDGKDDPHYITGGSWTDPFWDMTRIEGNAWAIRDIEKPDEGAELVSMFLRDNGDFVMLAKVTDSEGTVLYTAEIPGAG